VITQFDLMQHKKQIFIKPKYYIYHCIIPLLIGGLIYLGYRNSSLRMFRWIDILQLTGIINSYRSYIVNLSLPKWFIFSFPNGLWTYSFLIFILFVLSNNRLIVKLTLSGFVFTLTTSQSNIRT
jgi:hypothetical protein